MDATADDIEWLIAIENAEEAALKEAKQQAQMAEQMKQHKQAMRKREG